MGIKNFLVIVVCVALAASLYVGIKNNKPEITPRDSGGIMGKVLLGPQCPVVKEGESCPDKPYSTTLKLVDLQGGEVLKFTTNLEGKFSVEVPPGDYAIRSLTENTLPSCGKSGIIPVEQGKYADVIIFCDTGIR